MPDRTNHSIEPEIDLSNEVSINAEDEPTVVNND